MFSVKDLVSGHSCVPPANQGPPTCAPASADYYRFMQCSHPAQRRVFSSSPCETPERTSLRRCCAPAPDSSSDMRSNDPGSARLQSGIEKSR
jgi:hypothetical protein